MDHDLSAVEHVQEAVACLSARLQTMLATNAQPLAASKDRSTATSIHKIQIHQQNANPASSIPAPARKPPR
jgi:hypothetical protein